MSRSTQPCPTPSTADEALATLRRLQSETALMLRQRLEEQEAFFADFLDRQARLVQGEEMACAGMGKMSGQQHASGQPDANGLLQGEEVACAGVGVMSGQQDANGQPDASLWQDASREQDADGEQEDCMDMPVSADKAKVPEKLRVSKSAESLAALSASQRTTSTLGYHYTMPKELGMPYWRSVFENLKLQEPPRSGPVNTFLESTAFKALCGAVILANSVFAVRLADMQARSLQDLPFWAEALELSFLAFYTLEMALRLYLHRLYFFVGENQGSNIFDFSIVFLDLVSTGLGLLEQAGTIDLAFLRACRVIKISRVLRVLRASEVLSDLKILLDTMTSSFFSLVWCAIAIVFTLLLFALLFVQVVTTFIMNHPELPCHGEEGCLKEFLLRHFGSVSQGMLTLYMATTGGEDWNIYYAGLSETGAFASLAFVAFTFCYQFGMFNLLTSMFVERTMKVSTPNREAKILAQRSRESRETADLLELFSQECDIDKDGKITLSEFERLIANDSIAKYLASVGLEINDAYTFFKILLFNGEPRGPGRTSSVCVEQFVQGCMRLKGEATSIDVQGLWYQQHLLSRSMTRLERAVSKLSPGSRPRSAGCQQGWEPSDEVRSDEETRGTPTMPMRVLV